MSRPSKILPVLLVMSALLLQSCDDDPPELKFDPSADETLDVSDFEVHRFDVTPGEAKSISFDLDGGDGNCLEMRVDDAADSVHTAITVSFDADSPESGSLEYTAPATLKPCALEAHDDTISDVITRASDYGVVECKLDLGEGKSEWKTVARVVMCGNEALLEGDACTDGGAACGAGLVCESAVCISQWPFARSEALDGESRFTLSWKDADGLTRVIAKTPGIWVDAPFVVGAASRGQAEGFLFGAVADEERLYKIGRSNKRSFGTGPILSCLGFVGGVLHEAPCDGDDAIRFGLAHFDPAAPRVALMVEPEAGQIAQCLATDFTLKACANDDGSVAEGVDWTMWATAKGCFNNNPLCNWTETQYAGCFDMSQIADGDVPDKNVGQNYRESFHIESGAWWCNTNSNQKFALSYEKGGLMYTKCILGSAYLDGLADDENCFTDTKIATDPDGNEILRYWPKPGYGVAFRFYHRDEFEDRPQNFPAHNWAGDALDVEGELGELPPPPPEPTPDGWMVCENLPAGMQCGLSGRPECAAGKHCTFDKVTLAWTVAECPADHLCETSAENDMVYELGHPQICHPGYACTDGVASPCPAGSVCRYNRPVTTCPEGMTCDPATGAYTACDPEQVKFPYVCHGMDRVDVTADPLPGETIREGYMWTRGQAGPCVCSGHAGTAYIQHFSHGAAPIDYCACSHGAMHWCWSLGADEYCEWQKYPNANSNKMFVRPCPPGETCSEGKFDDPSCTFQYGCDYQAEDWEQGE